ncbi:universal stress protein [Brachybacterium huguangmaarense]|uniref:Universal stress protein n=1 Tax=Brachybacterium huguangmaarense TaxID=1652028 RepID=A0ABY6G529_9MICO|nr:universal stress protein [Brachybacterium huguangmaarense]UYG17734.1 universal stress protein [Brachybacterium huguangmaarense]
MSIVVGFGPDTRSAGGVRFAGQLARTTGEAVVLCCVIYDSFASPALRDFNGIDDDWRRELTGMASRALAESRRALPDGVEVEEVVRTSRSVPDALEREGRDRGARLLVVGSASSGAFGRIGLGTTSDRLVHSARIPVGLAPSGYTPDGEPVRRLVVAIGPGPAPGPLAREVARTADWLGASVDIVSFAVRGTARTAMSAFTDAEVYEHWTQLARDAQKALAASLHDRAPDLEIGRHGVLNGDRWSEAVGSYPWRTGDVAVVGSSSHGGLAQVFLGSTGSRILRTSPLPVMILPRP